ncbi:hypothetical protein [Coxiella endosymbiont of Amblyomma nuttalli]|uniref:hypothetical protein n=1 Tax=Coxiella endosymbiont of Amblyomma nuttalli TaxID=2749996 RepID=UPI001FD446B4|nr:hypothetical protein [Coxiella endosymbiont of Amblyomma nuttalli]
MEDQKDVSCTLAWNIKISGRRMTRLPEDLYVSPDALLVFLEAFEGPLDLLLYFITET